MGVASFLLCLYSSRSVQVTGILVQALAYLAFYIEQGAVLQALSEDPLEAPLPFGTRRKRRISGALKEAVARAVAIGSHGRTGAQVLQNMSRYQRRLMGASRKANDWTRHRVARYWQHVQAFCLSARCSTYALSMDATRAGFKDMLFSAMFLPEVRKAFWLPPQEPPPTQTPPPQSRRKHRRKRAANAGFGRRKHAAKIERWRIS